MEVSFWWQDGKMSVKCPFCSPKKRTNHYVFYVKRASPRAKSTHFIKHIQKHNEIDLGIRRNIINETFREAWKDCEIDWLLKRRVLKKIEELFPRKEVEVEIINEEPTVTNVSHEKDFELISNFMDQPPVKDVTNVFEELEPLFNIDDYY